MIALSGIAIGIVLGIAIVIVALKHEDDKAVSIESMNAIIDDWNKVAAERNGELLPKYIERNSK
jgi:hypothetical protein